MIGTVKENVVSYPRGEEDILNLPMWHEMYLNEKKLLKTHKKRWRHFLLGFKHKCHQGRWQKHSNYLEVLQPQDGTVKLILFLDSNMGKSVIKIKLDQDSLQHVEHSMPIETKCAKTCLPYMLTKWFTALIFPMGDLPYRFAHFSSADSPYPAVRAVVTKAYAEDRGVYHSIIQV